MWALKTESPDLTDAQLDRALRRRHDRPHARAAPDLALHRAGRHPWVLTAVAPRVQLRTRTMYRTYEVDAALMTRVRPIVEKTLGGGRSPRGSAIGKALAARASTPRASVSG